jgi:hypothetical protein
MASLTNQQSNTKSLTGLSDTYSNNIVCDTLDVVDEFTCEPGCIITLPVNSISDSALSTNVAFKNQNNIFTNTNTFNDTVTIARTGNQLFIRDPANTAPSTIVQTSNSLTLNAISGVGTSIVLNARSSTNVIAQVFIGSSGRVSIGSASGILDLRPLICNIFGTTITYPVAGSNISGGTLTKANNQVNNGTITNNGVVTNNTTINDIGTRYSYAGDRYVDVTNPLGPTSQVFQNTGELVLSTVDNLKAISLNTRDAVGTALENIRCSNGNRIQLQGTSAGEFNITGTSVTLSGVCSFTNVTTPVITQTIPTVDNTTKIATTAWVNLQNYLTSASLTPYALLTSVPIQIFTGQNQFQNASSGNQILIKDTANVGPSTISQVGTSLTISSVTNLTGFLRTNLVLATRTSANAGCVLLNGNENTLTLGQNSTTASITSPTVNLTGGNSFTAAQATIGGTSVPKITIQPLIGSNTNEIASTKFVKDQLYITASALTPYALLAPVSQIFSGNNNFPTQTTPDNSTLVATTAFVKNQGYAQLAPISQTFTGDNNFPTQSNGDNSTLVSTTAFVKNQGYAQLAATQTFTGQNTFALSGLEVIMNGGCLFNDVLLGASSSIINQSGVVCSVANNHDLGSVTLSTRTSLGIPRDNVYALNGNQGGLRGNSGNTIDITGTQATIGGTSVPVITTQPSAVSNSNEIASTAFVINKGYATTASLSSYALLTANQTFTGTQTCVAGASILPIKIQTQLAGYTGYSGGSLISDYLSYNPLNDSGNYSVIAFGTGIDAGGVLTLTTHSSTNCGIKITNSSITQTAPFNCGYLQIGAPVTTKTNYDLGYSKTITGGSFTGTAWATSSGAYNIMTIVWDGSNNFTLGVWQTEIYIVTQCTSSPAISFCWNTISNTSMAITEHCGNIGDFGAYAGTGYSIFRLSFVLPITDLLGTYWLNCSRVGGGGLASNTTYSYIKFTRLA